MLITQLSTYVIISVWLLGIVSKLENGIGSKAQIKKF